MKKKILLCMILCCLSMALFGCTSKDIMDAVAEKKAASQTKEEEEVEVEAEEKEETKEAEKEEAKEEIKKSDEVVLLEEINESLKKLAEEKERV